MKKYLVLSVAACLCLAAGCEVDSPNDVSRSVRINVAGVYRGTDGNNLVSQTSGRAVTSLDLRQSGDSLEAVDNNGIVFRGTIGSVQDSAASFNIEGASSTGNKALISGTISVSGNNGTMQGTWIEDNLFGTVSGTSSGQSVSTNAPSTNTNDVVISAGIMEIRDAIAYRRVAQWFSEG
ncbi:MAG: hypothetical protein H7A43_07105 [Verrucomicrobia bacterium]|nr:hypothetical protein [Kiritimatiellia bacterium]MCB1102714.1 hypothetical protein [Kiritimatiellia bacterium]MCP5488402.1 hypothetical protein [Verrucomicrobiota bacterium]